MVYNKEMAGFDKLQLLTLIFGAVVILDVVTAYNASAPDQRLLQLLEVLQQGIFVFFAGYAVVVTASASASQYNMYKWFIILLALAAWLFVLINTDASTSSGWGAVRQQVANPLAVGSLMALPVVLVARK